MNSFESVYEAKMHCAAVHLTSQKGTTRVLSDHLLQNPFLGWNMYSYFEDPGAQTSKQKRETFQYVTYIRVCAPAASLLRTPALEQPRGRCRKGAAEW